MLIRWLQYHNITRYSTKSKHLRPQNIDNFVVILGVITVIMSWTWNTILQSDILLLQHIAFKKSMRDFGMSFSALWYDISVIPVISGNFELDLFVSFCRKWTAICSLFSRWWSVVALSFPSCSFLSPALLIRE